MVFKEVVKLQFPPELCLLTKCLRVVVIVSTVRVRINGSSAIIYSLTWKKNKGQRVSVGQSGWLKHGCINHRELIWIPSTFKARNENVERCVATWCSACSVPRMLMFEDGGGNTSCRHITIISARGRSQISAIWWTVESDLGLCCCDAMSQINVYHHPLPRYHGNLAEILHEHLLLTTLLHIHIPNTPPNKPNIVN